MLLGEFDQLLPGIEIPQPPRSDDLQLRRQADIGQLEADLVVALAGGPVTDRIGPLRQCDPHLFLGDQRPGQRGAKEI